MNTVGNNEKCFRNVFDWTGQGKFPSHMNVSSLTWMIVYVDWMKVERHSSCDMIMFFALRQVE